MAESHPATHAEFVAMERSGANWCVDQPRRAFRMAWGPIGELVFWLHYGVCILGPILWLSYLCARWESYWLLGWAPLAVWTAVVSQRTVLGLLPGLAGGVVVGMPLWLVFGREHMLAALSPLLAWLVAVVVKHAVAGRFVARLRRSPEAWKRVSGAGLLREG